MEPPTTLTPLLVVRDAARAIDFYVLQLRVDDVDTIVARACEAGATVVFPVQEFCGERMGRLRDPFGHLWILSQRLEHLTPEENQARRDALFATLAAKTQAG